MPNNYNTQDNYSHSMLHYTDLSDPLAHILIQLHQLYL